MHYSMHSLGWSGHMVGEWLPFVAPFFLTMLLWGFLWQALGMWHAAKRGEWIWFLVFLFVHTLGILEIMYLFGIAKLKMDDLFCWSKKHGL